MTLSSGFINLITSSDSSNAWQTVVAETLRICRQPLDVTIAAREVISRDRTIGVIDNLISSTAWELWNDFSQSVESNSGSLVQWWKKDADAKAILILDGLSLRELPLIIQGAEKHGLIIRETKAYASEIPAETNEFARALGFSSRSSLTNNGAGTSHLFPKAKTDCINMPWKDAAGLIDAHPYWVVWHQWPDIILHQDSGQGQGIDGFAQRCADELSSDDFWLFVKRLAQGRSLVITSDHGYAASGLFSNASEEVGNLLKKELKSGRSIAGDGDTGPFIPPVMIQHENAHGIHRLAVGRWNWKSQGGYPTLAHGGLSLLEVLSPWVELQRNA
jgi:hypothetical protein